LRREGIFRQLKLDALLIGQIWRDVGSEKCMKEKRWPAALAADISEVLVAASIGLVCGHSQPIRVISGSSTGVTA
jgi:hypothetical protein